MNNETHRKIAAGILRVLRASEKAQAFHVSRRRPIVYGMLAMHAYRLADETPGVPEKMKEAWECISLYAHEQIEKIGI